MQLLSELQRRNVFRVAIGYVVSCWLLLQVADLVLENIGAPDWVIQAIMLVLALGFPIVLFFSWAYEVTPEGIKRESEVDRSQSITQVTGRKLDRAIVLVLALAVTYLALDKYVLSERDPGEATATEARETPANTPPQPAASSESDNSIAVLPFSNMSADASSGYFSDGLADTLLHMLAQVSELRVAARTSSFKFRDAAMDIGDIGRQLNVSSVLEGSVQKSGDTIRVTAQLIDVDSGFHLWSGNFDRDLTDVFAIQDEIAQEVVDALKLQLLGESTDSLNRGQTDNIDAYTEYLLAIDDLSSSTSESLKSAVSHLQAAIELDPDYAQAYSALGRVYIEMENYGSMPTVEVIRLARAAASKALDLNPESPQALAVLGQVELLDGNMTQARALLEKATELGPNDEVAHEYYAYYLMNDARPKEAIDEFRKVLRLDPLYEQGYLALGGSLASVQRHEEAEEAFRSVLRINPNNTSVYFGQANVQRDQGNLAAAVKIMADSMNSPADDANDPEGAYVLGFAYLELGMPEMASRSFDKAVEIDPEHPVSLAAPLVLDYALQQDRAESQRLATELLENRIDDRRGARFIALQTLADGAEASGQQERLLELLDNLYPQLFDDPPHDLDKDLTGLYFAGRALLTSGQTQRGAEFIEAYLASVERYSKAYGTGWPTVAGHLLLGDREAALDALAEYRRRSNGSWFAQMVFRNDSVFDPIRDDPSFVELIDSLETHATEQRQLLLASNTN